MSQKFGTPIDLTGNVIKNAGIEVVSSLPTDFLVDGREVIFQGEVFRCLNGEWHINSFSAYSLKTYTELKALKDNNALVTGNQYVLTDFYTTYLAEDGETWLGAPDCEVIDHLGNPIVSDNYHILLQATSENTFSPQAYIFNQSDSEKYYMKRLSDWIVYFDFEQDLFGRITYMYDTRYKCTYDFDIYNIRWCWKGFQIDLALLPADIAVIGQIEPNADYYLWTIGDIKCCNETVFDINTLSSDFPYGVMENSILDSSKIFINVHSKSLMTSAFYNAIFRNCSIKNSSNIVAYPLNHSMRIEYVSNLYMSQGGERFNLYQGCNILCVGYGRGLNIGISNTFGEVCKYLSFFTQSAAYVDHSIFLARYSVFIGIKGTPTIIQPLTEGYPRIENFAFINENTAGIGGTNASLNGWYPSHSELRVPALNKDIIIKADYFSKRKFIIPEEIDTISDEINIELISSGNNTYLNYINPQNEPVRTNIDNAIIIDTAEVIFYEEFIRKRNNTYFMPFVSFIENPTSWGYEIEGIKYPTHEDFPVLAGVFCNSGSTTTQFAGKNLKFYVTSGGTTFYSSEYTINSNGTITVVK